METIFTSPLFFLFCVEALIVFLLNLPKAVSLPVAQLIKKFASSTAGLVSVPLCGLVFATSLFSLVRTTTFVDTKE